MTKAERRALQEAQRAAKAAAKPGGGGGGSSGAASGGAGAAPRLQKQGSGTNLARQGVSRQGSSAKEEAGKVAEAQQVGWY